MLSTSLKRPGNTLPTPVNHVARLCICSRSHAKQLCIGRSILAGALEIDQILVLTLDVWLNDDCTAANVSGTVQATDNPESPSGAPSLRLSSHR